MMIENLFPSKLAAILLTLSGLYPRRQDFTAKLLKWFTCFCIIITAPLVLIKMFEDIKNIDVLAPTFESMMTFYQVQKPKMCFKYSIL